MATNVINPSEIKFVVNAFSAQMIDLRKMQDLEFTPISETVFNAIKGVIPSAVGHPDTATVLGVKMNRCFVRLEKGDKVLLAQLSSGRLPEGCKTLPEGFEFLYSIVTVK